MSRLYLTFEEWPAPDRAIWQSLVTEGDPLDDRGRLARLREESRWGHVYSYGRWLGWLSAAEPGALDEDPVGRATPERVCA